MIETDIHGYSKKCDDFTPHQCSCGLDSLLAALRVGRRAEPEEQEDDQSRSDQPQPSSSTADPRGVDRGDSTNQSVDACATCGGTHPGERILTNGKVWWHTYCERPDVEGTEPRPIISDAVNMIQAIIDFPLDCETRDALEGIVLRVVMAVEACAQPRVGVPRSLASEAIARTVMSEAKKESNNSSTSAIDGAPRHAGAKETNKR